MSLNDKLMLGVPALAGGMPILLKLLADHHGAVRGVGFYLGCRASGRGRRQCKTALAAISGLVALGGFIMRQWLQVPAPVAEVPEGADRQRLLPQHQQQCRHLRLHHRRGRGAGMQGGVPGLLFPATSPLRRRRRTSSTRRIERLADEDLRRRCRFRGRRRARQARPPRPAAARRRTAVGAAARQGAGATRPRLGQFLSDAQAAAAE